MNSDVAIKKPKITLPGIPTLGASDLKRKLGIESGKPMFRNAIVTKPAKREGVASWSIEPAFTSADTFHLNSDGTRIATTSRYEDNKVAIWDQEGKPTHIIPAQDVVKQVQWSPDPNIFAVIENGDRRKQIVVWKLFEKHAEVINVIPADGKKVSWSWDGLLLAIETQREIAFVDLAKGGVYAHPNFGVHGSISANPWSADGRYFASTVENDVKIWDLEERKLFHIFNGKREARFLPSGTRVSMKDDENWELWDLNAFTRDAVIEPDASWLKAWPSQNFEKIAGITEDTQLVVKDLTTGEQSQQSLRYGPESTVQMLSDDNLKDLSEIHWFNIDAGILCNFGRYYPPAIARSAKSDISELVSLKPLPRFDRQHVSIGSSNDSDLRDFSSSHMVYVDRSPEFGELGKFTAFDFNIGKHYPLSEFSIGQTSAKCRISPNGKYVAVLGSDILAVDGVLPPEFSKDLKKLRICDVQTGRVIKTIEAKSFVHEFLWSPRSDSLIISRVESKSEELSVKQLINGAHGRYFYGILNSKDANADGKLTVSEAASNMKNLDFNDDGFISIEEYTKDVLDSMAADKKTNKFFELETLLWRLDENVGRPLALEEAEGAEEEGSKFCFQRQPKDNYARYGLLVKPVIHKDQIVLPLFETVTFRGGSRIIPQSNNRSPHKDNVGFFNVETGKLEKVIELGQQLNCRYIDVNDDWVLANYNGERRNLNTFTVVSRKRDKEFLFPNTQLPAGGFNEMYTKKNWENKLSSSDLAGHAALAPKHPYVSLLTKRAIYVWAIKNGTMERTRILRLDKGWDDRYVERLVWHPTKPILGWVYRNKAGWFDVEKKQHFTDDSLDPCIDLAATENGWITAGWKGINKFDNDLNIKKRWFATARFTDLMTRGTFDQCVSADGKIHWETKDNLRMVQMIGNRIETTTIDEVARQ